MSFRWVDEPLYDRAQTIIPGLIRRVNRLEAEKIELELELKAQISKEKGGSRQCNWALVLLILTWFVIITYTILKKDEDEDC